MQISIKGGTKSQKKYVRSITKFCVKQMMPRMHSLELNIRIHSFGKEDTYGYCLDTAEPIGLKRLIARPVAKYTIAAQEKHEKNEKVHADD